jgi:uncharacterized membrane protein
MLSLTLAAAVFLVMHLLVSGTRVRDTLVGAVGRGPYMALFSLASVACLVWLGLAFAGARSAPSNTAYWVITPLMRDIQLVLQLLAIMLVVVGLTTPNPTSVAQEGVLDRPNAVGGVLRITRHPFLWGVAIWAFGHLLVNGSVAALILFGSLLVLAVAGTVSIDAKRKRALGERWNVFAAQTSNVPFGVIVSGRQTLDLKQIGWWRLASGVAIYAVLLAGHRFMFGASPLG